MATDRAGDLVYLWRLSKQAAKADSIIPENFNGTVQCDDGSEMACWMKGHNDRRRPPPNGGRRAGCMAHVRRKFEKVWQDSGRR